MSELMDELNQSMNDGEEEKALAILNLMMTNKIKINI